MNLLEFCSMLVADCRKAVTTWGLSPIPPNEPLGTPEIKLPVLRLEIAITKLREAWGILHECSNLITVLSTFADVASGDKDADLTVETRRRITGRVDALRERMMKFQVIDPHVALGSTWTPTEYSPREMRFIAERDAALTRAERAEAALAPVTADASMSCGCAPGVHMNARNYLESKAEDEGPTCSLGWPLYMRERKPAKPGREPISRQQAIRIARENFIKHNDERLLPDRFAVWSASEWVIRAIIEASR